MTANEQGAAEAREKLADKIASGVTFYGRNGMMTVFLSPTERDLVLAALRAQPKRGAEEWNYDMSAAPVGPDNSVLLTVPSLHADCPPFVGEAWYCTEEAGEGWWWSGSGPTTYHASPISETNAEPIAWRHRPDPAAIRALPLHPDKEGGGHGSR